MAVPVDPLPAALPGAVDRAPDALRLGSARAAESRRRWCWWSTATCPGSRRKASPGPTRRSSTSAPIRSSRAIRCAASAPTSRSPALVGADAAGAVAQRAEAWRVSLKQIEDRRKTVIEIYRTQIRAKGRGGRRRRCRRAITGKWLSACMNKAARREHDPRQRVPDGARGDDDHASRAATSATPRPAASAGAWARRSAPSSPRPTRP